MEEVEVSSGVKRWLMISVVSLGLDFEVRKRKAKVWFPLMSRFAAKVRVF